MVKFSSMAEVRKANKAAGFHWFERSTMRFFQCRIESRLLKGRYFISSEQGPSGERLFTLRQVEADGGVDTVGDFQAHRTKADAKRALRLA